MAEAAPGPGPEAGSSSLASHESERQQLLSSLLSAVKQCQIRFGGRKSELATDKETVVLALCNATEAVLGHGLKSVTKPNSVLTSTSSVMQVRDLIRSAAAATPTVTPTFWPFVKLHLNRQELERYYLLKTVNTDLGRSRAWLRSALNEHSLERYMLSMSSADEAVLQTHYEPWAFLSDGERSSVLPAMSAGLNSILFAIKIDRADLNEPAATKAAAAHEEALVARRSVTSVSSVEEALEATVDNVEESSGGGNKGKKKKKRKVPAQVISFNDDEITTERLKPRVTKIKSPPASTVAAAGASPANHSTTHDLINSLEKQVLLSQTASKRRSRAHGSASPAPASAPLSASSSQAQLDYCAPVNLSKPHDSEDEIDIYSRSPTGSRSNLSINLSMDGPDDEAPGGGAGGGGGSGGSGRAKLTPLKNSAVGALIPIGQGGLSGGEDVQSEDSLSIRSYGEESDYATSSLGGATSRSGVQSSRKLQLRGDEPGHVPNKPGSANTASMLSREDLKQALLSVMERKNELDDQCKDLKKLLNKESSLVASLREELSEEKRKSEDVREKHSVRVQTLGRENELLKHQLKKYVGAVQKLRDGPQAYETLAELERKTEHAEQMASKYVDYHYEASEYEKKLIQVAEMHGELIEFNEHLQKTVQAKDALIQRMREELIDLRGPLPDMDAGSSAAGGGSDIADDALSVISVESMSSTSRSLLNIWIPSVFLSGSGSRQHHVYQVYLRIKDEEWNIYRRYSDFYALHRELRQQEARIESFDFPPKKTMGNKADKVVEDRRKRLQSYLRRIVNLLVQTNPSLSTRPSKENVLLLMPFFAENHPNAGHGAGGGRGVQSRSQSQGRSIFNRRRSTVTSPGQLAL